MADEAPRWAILELMGHRVLAGQVSEIEQFATKMCRITVPAVGDVPAFTQDYGGHAIYALSYVTEETARFKATKLKAQPIDYYDVRAVARQMAEQIVESQKPLEVTYPAALPGGGPEDDDDLRELDDDDFPV